MEKDTSVRFISEVFRPDGNITNNNEGHGSIDINIKHGVVDLDNSNVTSPSP